MNVLDILVGLIVQRYTYMCIVISAPCSNRSQGFGVRARNSEKSPSWSSWLDLSIFRQSDAIDATLLDDVKWGVFEVKNTAGIEPL